MADMPVLTPRDYDPWHLASPLQLLALLERLGVSMTEVGRWLHVPRSSLSMWRHGTRAMPPKHLPTLRTRAQEALQATAELTDKAAHLAPTAALREALQHEFATLYTRWKAEVLADAGTFAQALERNYATLGALIRQAPYRREDIEDFQRITDTMVQQMELLLTLQGEAPRPEDELLARLEAAHEAHAAAHEGAHVRDQ